MPFLERYAVSLYFSPIKDALESFLFVCLNITHIKEEDSTHGQKH